MSKVAIVYWSGTGNTEAMADLIAQGVRAKGGAAHLIHASDFNAARLEEFDAFAFGCPAMGDEELATMLNRFAEGEDAPHYCRNLPECNTDMEADNLIPLERCQACLLHWLQQPAEGDVSDARIS